jgi:hypothetical protein
MPFWVVGLAALLLLVSLLSMHTANRVGGWPAWAWLFLGVNTGTLAINTLVPFLRRRFGRRGRTMV